MTEQGKVQKIKGGTVYVELKRNDKCNGCKMCAFNKNNVTVLPAVCDIPVEVGQTVTMQMPTKSVGAVALLIYALPLLFTVVGAVIGLVGEWWLQLTLAAIGLTIGLACIAPIERIYRKKAGVLPTVLAVEIRSENTENGDERNGT